MLLPLAALSSAVDALQSLTSSKGPSSSGTGFRNAASAFDIPSSSAGSSAPASTGFSQLSPQTLSALLASQSQAPAATPPTASSSRSDALKDLFSLIDENGDGKITKSEFEDVLGAGGTNLAKADDVFGKLDANGDDAVSLDEISSALKGSRGHHHHHHHVEDSSGPGDAGQVGGTDPLLEALSGASSSSVTNSDGSTTTSVTYADGSKVTMISPASNKGASGASSSYNFIEQLIAREAQAISSGASGSLSLKV
jgi:EF-hand domain pair